MAHAAILIVEDRDSLRRMLAHALTQVGYEVAEAHDGAEGVRALAARRFDLVLTDLRLPDLTGIDILRASRQAHPSVPVVVLTGFGTVATAVEAMKLGAFDFLEKPVELDDLQRLIERALGGREEPDIYQAQGAPPIVGTHPKLRAALRMLARVAPTESTVLLTGESGTGKEIFARTLHALSARRDGPWIAINCAAIPESLLENELFGHEKGAFTGADRRQAGRFELAERGTLFLDEIGELPLAVQGKVLRVLEERTFERIGGGRSLRADVRLVAATNRSLGGMVERGEFRADLLYRLNVFPIELPSLRERSEDVPILARYLIEEIAKRHRMASPLLDDEAASLLAQQAWPGNVRELANVLERTVILCEGGRVRVEDLASVLPSPRGDAAEGSDEREVFYRALVAAGGDKVSAAEALGVSYRTFQRKVKELDLEGVPKYRR